LQIAGLQDCRIAERIFKRTLILLQSCNPAILQYYGSVEAPKHRPLERFWPYADLPEQPTDEELASLDPELHDALFEPTPHPFSITLVFPPLEVPDFARALDLARGAAECRETGSGASRPGVRDRRPRRRDGSADRRSSRALRAAAVAATRLVLHPAVNPVVLCRRASSNGT
jgi:hypothetical protein